MDIKKQYAGSRSQNKFLREANEALSADLAAAREEIDKYQQLCADNPGAVWWKKRAEAAEAELAEVYNSKGWERLKAENEKLKKERDRGFANEQAISEAVRQVEASDTLYRKICAENAALRKVVAYLINEGHDCEFSSNPEKGYCKWCDMTANFREYEGRMT